MAPTTEVAGEESAGEVKHLERSTWMGADNAVDGILAQLPLLAAIQQKSRLDQIETARDL